MQLTIAKIVQRTSIDSMGKGEPLHISGYIKNVINYVIDQLSKIKSNRMEACSIDELMDYMSKAR